MRTLILGVLFFAVTCAATGNDGIDDGEAAAAAPEAGMTDAAGALVRVPLLNGVYSVVAPSEWHLEISGGDLTATFSEEADANGALIISAPNPTVTDIREYMRLAAGDIIDAFGGGEIVQENEEDVDGFPAHTIWFSSSIAGVEFLGWGRTIDFDGVAVQAMALATAQEFVPYMQKAGPIFDSYELNTEMLEENLDLFQDIGSRILEQLRGTDEETPEEADEAA